MGPLGQSLGQRRVTEEKLCAPGSPSGEVTPAATLLTWLPREHPEAKSLLVSAPAAC